MAKRKRYLTATMADGYVKTIGPTASPFTHYWRIVAHLEGGRSEVFWGHARSLKEATGKTAATDAAARKRGWLRYDFEVVELVESPVSDPASPPPAPRSRPSAPATHPPRRPGRSP